jgi:hypothetical protein
MEGSTLAEQNVHIIVPDKVKILQVTEAKGNRKKAGKKYKNLFTKSIMSLSKTKLLRHIC